MHEGQKEQFQSTIEVGIQVLRTAILINGGAAIALLTFIGNYSGDVELPYLLGALKIFSFGIVSAALGGCLAYVSQRLHLGSISKHGVGSRIGFFMGNVGVGLIFVSVFMFAFASYKASCAF